MPDLTERCEEIDAATGEVTVPVRLTAEEFATLQSHALAQRRKPDAQAAVFISEAMKCWRPTVAPKPAVKPVAKVRPVAAKPDAMGPSSIDRLGAD